MHSPQELKSSQSRFHIPSSEGSSDDHLTILGIPPRKTHYFHTTTQSSPPKMHLGLENKLVLVTGSTKGIGKAIADSFLSEGARTIVNGRSQQEVQTVVTELNAKYPHNGEPLAVGIAADLSTPEGRKQLFTQVDLLKQPLEVLVNNVGIFAVKDFFEVTDEEWDRYHNVNVMTAVALSRHYLKGMLEQNSGRILMVSSEAGVRTIPTMIPYSVSKASMNALARGLAELTKGTNVTVNSVLPGPTYTEGVQEYLRGLAKHRNQSIERVTKEYFTNGERTSLIQRFLSPSEVADVTVFLASKNASGINGTSQRVEGGIIGHI
mmetsp:Transcript_9478/g.35177  ORF Transcript_9478/g.35177 Transcript_9478/m.35177 type:complete len:321 (-) Transcript_9478:2140-3102(-)